MPASNPNLLRIATRESPLALWQAEHVAALLRALHPQMRVELVPMTTRGDQILDRALAAIGGKGLFLKELEVAMLDGRADLAVHSLKDVPMQLEPGFALAAILPREDPADALVSQHYATLAELPKHARVGTSSLRRRVQLKRLRPDLRISDLRGNVNTRLAKLDADQYDAIVLAAAGLVRLGFGARIRERLIGADFIPAAGQAALAIETLSNAATVQALVAPLACANTTACVRAERSLSAALGGSCHVPIAAYSTKSDNHLHMTAMVGALKGRRVLHAVAEGMADEPELLGARLAGELLARGARQLLQG